MYLHDSTIQMNVLIRVDKVGLQCLNEKTTSRERAWHSRLLKWSHECVFEGVNLRLEALELIGSHGTACHGGSDPKFDQVNFRSKHYLQ